jgi:hypothetical protein
MTGKPNSNLRLRLAVILTVSAFGQLHADELTLTGDDKLTGTIRSIDESGVVELSSSLSPSPVRLRPGAVEKVAFSAPESAPVTPGALVELSNGDILPAVVKSLDGENLKVFTTDAGELNIPRTALKSLQFGVQQLKPIYSGPNNIEEWTHPSDAGPSWRFVDKTLAANGPAKASKSFDTPLQFILKFTLKWQANPNFQVYFADPLQPKREAVDRYYMQFNAAGLEIKRESTKGKKFQTVILLARTPEQFPTNQVEVEIRVDRKSSRIHLHLNGEPETSGIDPTGDPPVGNGVSLVNSSPVGITQEIRSIELLNFDNSRARHRSEDRGDPKTDSLISRDEDRWGGRLLGIRDSRDGPVFSFKSDFQEEPLELLESDISTLFFAQSSKENELPADHHYVLRLRGDGSLQVASCVFSDGGITVKHPLLGALKFDRAGVTGLERVNHKLQAEAALVEKPETASDTEE